MALFLGGQLALNWEPVSVKDVAIIAGQIKRRPRQLHGIGRRCWNHAPQVVVNHPLPQGDQDAHFFPTVFWLTCPEAIRHISRIEDLGIINQVQMEMRRNQAFLQDMRDAHLEYIYIRRTLLGPEHMLRLRASEKSLAKHVETVGIGGTADFEGVKCLHMHYAHYLVTGNNPIGGLVKDLIQTNLKQWNCAGCKQKQFCLSNQLPVKNAGVAELADAADLKSAEPKGSCRFEPGPRHHPIPVT